MKGDSRIQDLMELNSEQRFCLDLERDMLVEAGAGSGKTRALVARYLKILEDNRADVDGILAITFTENAASEMRDRIRMEIGRYINEFGQKNYLDKKCVKKVSSALISTIHGFAARVIRENPFELGVDPNFSIIEGIERTIFEKDAIHQFINYIWNSGDQTKQNMLEQVLVEERFEQNRVEEKILEILTLANRLHFELPWKRIAHKSEDEKSLISDLINSVEVNLDSSSNSKAQERIDKINEYKRLLAYDTDSIDVRDTIKKLKMLLKSKSGRKGLIDLSKVETEILDGANNVLNSANKVLNQFDINLTDSYLKLAEEAYIYLSENKRAGIVLNYEDLLLIVRNLFKSDKQLLKRYRNKIKFIMVDEFQDTDSLQFEIIELLTRDSGANLFLVGDPKQAIYSFRGGDLDLFHKVKNEFETVNKLVSNYRSGKTLTEFYNEFFKNHLGDIHEPMFSASNGTTDENCVELMFSSGDTSYYRRRNEALNIVRKIVEIRSLGTEFKEIAIILRSSTHISIYESVLADKGIPFKSYSGSSFFSQREVRDLITLLRYLLYPNDELAQACVLRSPLFGAGDVDILKYRKSKEIDAGFESFLSFLEEIRKEILLLSPYQALEFIVESTGFKSTLLALRNGKLKYSNINKLLTMFKNLNHSGQNIFEILELLESSLDIEKEPLAQLETEEGDAVHILTVHKAKGLEFPVVILADMNHRTGFSWESVKAIKNEGFLITHKESNSELRERVLDIEKVLDVREEKRMLYVAATRAMNKLIFSIAGKKKNGFIKSDRNTFSEFVETEMGYSIEGGNNELIRYKDFKFRLTKSEEEGPDPVAVIDGSTSNKCYSIDTQELQPRFNKLYTFDGDTFESNYLKPLNQTADPVQLGSLRHRFLQLWDFDSGSIEKNIDFVLNESYISSDLIFDDLRRLALNFLNSELLGRIENSNRIYKEYKFYVQVEGEPIRGVIDLLLEDNEGTYLFDYKSSHNVKELEKYKEQLDLYSTALTDKYGNPPKEKCFVLLPDVNILKY